MGERLPKKEILSCIIGVYVSLVDGLVWDQKAASSNLAIPTIVIDIQGSGSSLSVDSNR